MNVTVIGAGNSGLAMAGHLAINGERVNLWNRSQSTISKIIETRVISISGVINQKASIYNATTSIEDAISEADLILVTTPANAHRELARLLSPYLRKDSVVLLNPGRTFGAVEFQNTLVQEKCRVVPVIAEAQTIIYTCRKTEPDSVNILSLKKDVLLASIGSSNETVIGFLPSCIQSYFSPAKNMVETSFGNVGMILHCAPSILNSGWIESPYHSFRYYYDGITPSIASLLESLDSERMGVASRIGCEIESTSNWLKRSYGVSGNNLYECIHDNDSYKTIDAPSSLNHRYITEDIPCGLVPLEAIGNKLGVKVKLCTLLIDIASALTNTDYRTIGRNLSNVGLSWASESDIKSILGVG